MVALCKSPSGHHRTTLSGYILATEALTARHSSSGRQPNFAAWDKEIRQDGHHVVTPCHI